MKAFLLSIAVLLAVALSAAYLLDGVVAEDAGVVFSSGNVRL